MRLRIVRNATWRILAVESPSGECELLTFLQELRLEIGGTVDGMFALFQHVSHQGPQRLPDSLCHQLDEGIWEFIKGKIRVLWFYDAGRVVICSHGFKKKTQRTPREHISYAKEVRRKYLTDKANDEIEIIDEDE